MKNLLFIFLISLLVFSCVKKDDAVKVSSTTGYSLTTAGTIDSMHWKYNQFYRFRLSLVSGFDTFNTIMFKHGTPDSVCEYLAFLDTLANFETIDSVTYPFVPCYSFYKPATPYDYNNSYTNGNIRMKASPNFNWHNYLDSFSFHDHFINDSFVSTIGTNTIYNSATIFFKDTANPHTVLPIHLIAVDSVFEIRY